MPKDPVNQAALTLRKAQDRKDKAIIREGQASDDLREAEAERKAAQDAYSAALQAYIQAGLAETGEPGTEPS
jgi:hypothetical protein